MVFVYGIQFTLIRHSSKKYQLKGKELVNLNNVEIDIKIVPIPISVLYKYNYICVLKLVPIWYHSWGYHHSSR